MPEDSNSGIAQQAQSVVGQTQDRVRDQVDQRSTQLGDQLQQQASDLRAVSDSLRQQGKAAPARTAERLAGYAEHAGGYLRERSADALLSDMERMGRERPGAVAAGALAIGFAASRLLKASSGRRYRSQGSMPRPAAQAPRPVMQSPPVSDPLMGIGPTTGPTEPAISTRPATVGRT